MNWEALQRERELHLKGDHTYNGKTFEQVKANLREDMHPLDKERYLYNVSRVIDNLTYGHNLHENDDLRNVNFRIIKHYIDRL